jgi:hypothetical protein
MLKYKLTSVFSIAAIFFLVSISSAAVATGASGAGSSPSSVKVLEKTVVVQKIESNTLYTINGQKFDLRNAKVSNFTSGGKNATRKKMITAELMFVNGVLKEVVIREK